MEIFDIKEARDAYNDSIIDGIIWTRRKVNINNKMAKKTISKNYVEATEQVKCIVKQKHPC